MSYVRMGPDSDVYVIGTLRGGIPVLECCGCKFNTERKQYTDEEIKARHLEWAVGDLGLWYNVHPDPAYTTAAEMITHLDQHRIHGHKVPARPYKRLRDPETQQWLDGEDQT